MTAPQKPQCIGISVSSDEKQQDMSLSISTNGNASITVSVEVNGTIYSGLYAGRVHLLPESSSDFCFSVSFSAPKKLKVYPL